MAAALATALLAAALLAACGGSASTSNSSTTSEATTTSTSASGKGPAGSGNGRSSEPSSPKSSGAHGGEAGAVATPLHVSGGGSAQFRVKGGDNSIQNFGEESGESELKEAAEALHGFYVARAEENWGRACGYLEKTMVAQLEQLASQSSQLQGKGCAGALKAFTRPLPASVRRETTVVDAGSLRHEGERAFLIYRGEGNAVFAVPMRQEEGAWKIGALAGTSLD
jgi:hypothetical protein